MQLSLSAQDGFFGFGRLQYLQRRIFFLNFCKEEISFSISAAFSVKKLFSDSAFQGNALALFSVDSFRIQRVIRVSVFQFYGNAQITNN